MKSILDITYDTPGGVELKADLFIPTGGASAPPVILFLHGGGWRVGDRKLAPDLVRFFAREGFAMISIDYRLSGTAIFPAALEDVKTAIRWTRTVSAEYGFDASRLGLWGSSAGAHLAALAVTSLPGSFAGGRYLDQSDEVQAVVDGYGPVDFLQEDKFRDPDGKPSEDAESIQLPRGKLSADADSLESLFIGAPIETVPDRVREANPAAHARAGLPPFLILHGTSDTAVPWQQSELLFQALSSQGTAATIGLVEGLGHGFFNRNDLDDRGPRTIRLRSSENPDAEERRSSPVFALVGEFFKRTLSA